MKNAIVTGATGYIGSWLTRDLLDNDVGVTAVIRKESDINILPHDKKLKTVFCDMSEYDRLPGLLPFAEDTVFYHFAWDGVTGKKRTDAALQFNNVLGTISAVKAAKEAGCVKFVGAGSIMEKEAYAAASVNGLKPGLPYIYGEAKHTAHLTSKVWAAEYGIPHVWAEITNPYGEFDRSERFINTTLTRIFNGEELHFSAGTQMYDFIYMGDAARALRLIGEYGHPFCEYLVGSGEPRPLREFIEIAAREAGAQQELQFGSVPYTGAKMSVEDFSIESLTEDTGFVPETDFAEGIRKTIRWMRENNDK